MKLVIELLLLAGLAVCFCNHMHFKKNIERNSLDYATTSVLKGMAISVIMIHHMVLRMSGAGVLLPFRGLGYLGVTIFFFLSGYGLTCSAEKKGKDYARGFLGKRFLMIYIPAIFANLIYMIVRCIFFAESYTPVEWVKGLLLMVDVDSSMWYIIAAFVWYIAFWISMRLFQEKNKKLLFFTAVSIFYIIVCLTLGLSKNWIDTAFMFPLGAALASYPQKLWQKINHCRIALWLPVSLILCGGCMALSFGKEDNFSLILRIFSTFFFIAALLLLLRLIDVSANKICAFLGTITLECYLIHGKIIRLVKLYFGQVEALEILVYLAVTAACIAIFCYLYQQYKNAVNALWRKE